MGQRPLGVSRQKEGEGDRAGVGSGNGKTRGFETFTLAFSFIHSFHGLNYAF